MIISLENCIVSFQREWKDKDTENYITTNYIDKLKKQGIEYEDKEYYFKAENLDINLLIESVKETCDKMNSLYTTLQSQLTSIPSTLGTTEDIDLCIDTIFLWLGWLEASQFMPRYTKKVCPKQELALFLHNQNK